MVKITKKLYLSGKGVIKNLKIKGYKGRGWNH